MSKNLYITVLDPKSGKSLVALGIMEFLIRNLKKVAFFRPIINVAEGSTEPDKITRLIATHYNLKDYNLKNPYETMYGFTLDEARSLIAMKKHGELLEGILEKYKALESEHDFILCLGTDFENGSSVLDFELNVQIANNLSCPILMLANGQDETIDAVVRRCQFAVKSFEDKGASILSLIVNKIAPPLQVELIRVLRSQMQKDVELIYSLPYEEILDRLTIAEVVKALDGKVLYGERQLKRPISRFVVAAMNLRNFLPRLVDDALVIAPIDRLDIILGTLAAFRSDTMPNISGMILTGHMAADSMLRNLLHGMKDLFPIIKVEEDTFVTANRVQSIRNTITPEAERKIAAALGLFESNIDTSELRKHIGTHTMVFTSPKMFEFGLLKRAREHKQRIVLPEGEEDRILAAAEILIHRDVVEIVLLGRKAVVQKKISGLGLDLGAVEIINPLESPYFDEYSETYFQLRKRKGITPDNARDVISGVNSFGTMMVYKGHADGMVSGAVHSTLNTVRPSLEFIKTKPGSTIMSSVIFMCLENRVLVYGDCAVNPRPTAEQLAEIAVESAKTARLFNITPLVAMLSYSSGTSGIGEEVERVKKATEIARAMDPELLIEGPIQYDAAVDATVAKTKMPTSEVAGKATVFIFPDLNTGNNTYKAVQRSAKTLAIGPIMQGLNRPVNDLSRGCLVPDIVNTIAITAIQAQAEKGLI